MAKNTLSKRAWTRSIMGQWLKYEYQIQNVERGDCHDEYPNPYEITARKLEAQGQNHRGLRPCDLHRFCVDGDRSDDCSTDRQDNGSALAAVCLPVLLPVRSFVGKEDEMVKRRFLLAIGVCSIMLVSLSISSFTIMASPLNHHSTRSAQFSAAYHLDCFRRQYNFSHKESSSVQQDASNYFMSLV
jgi:hypothetical protein